MYYLILISISIFITNSFSIYLFHSYGSLITFSVIMLDSLMLLLSLSNWQIIMSPSQSQSLDNCLWRAAFSLQPSHSNNYRLLIPLCATCDSCPSGFFVVTAPSLDMMFWYSKKVLSQFSVNSVFVIRTAALYTPNYFRDRK